MVQVTVSEKPDHAEMTVSDNGAGIEADLLQRVFDPFVQAAQSLDRSMGGLGIGLSIVKEITELHGGMVSAESGGLGKGTTIIIRLPLEKRAGIRQEPSDRYETKGALRILVVEDNMDLADAVANALSDCYAMGVQPSVALNLVGFPTSTLPLYVLDAILKGGSEKASEANVTIIGGHTIDDPEPKYGMAVVGFTHPDAVVSNAGAVKGDKLILTKPLGMGIITNAIKFSDPNEPVRVATKLNGNWAEVWISNTGQVIEDAQRENIFDKFRQCDGSNTRTVGGCGLGLFLARHLVRLHGGQIQLAECHEKQTTFVVRLPIEMPPEIRAWAEPE
jgi:two-component sensor histidine kinase